MKAQYNLAVLYLEGAKGLQKNPQKALQLLELAAKSGLKQVHAVGFRKEKSTLLSITFECKMFTYLPPATKLGQGYTCLILFIGGWCPSMHCSRSPREGVVSQHALQVSRPTPRGEVEGSGQGGSPGPHPRGKLRGLVWPGGSPGPHVGGGCIPACAEADPLPRRLLLLRAVRILLECILVHCSISSYRHKQNWVYCIQKTKGKI